MNNNSASFLFFSGSCFTSGNRSYDLFLKIPFWNLYSLFVNFSICSNFFIYILLNIYLSNLFFFLIGFGTLFFIFFLFLIIDLSLTIFIPCLLFSFFLIGLNNNDLLLIDFSDDNSLIFLFEKDNWLLEQLLLSKNDDSFKHSFLLLFFSSFQDQNLIFLYF